MAAEKEFDLTQSIEDLQAKVTSVYDGLQTLVDHYTLMSAKEITADTWRQMGGALWALTYTRAALEKDFAEIIGHMYDNQPAPEPEPQPEPNGKIKRIRSI